MENRRIAATTILALFAFGLLVKALPVSATVSGSLDLVRPDLVAPGGPIELDASLVEATGGTTYFYISENDDPEISPGDIYFASEKTADLDDSVTVFIPTTIDAFEEYYIKATDLKRSGTEAIVADDTFEVPETYPTVTIDPDDKVGNVGDTPKIEGEDAEDYDTATLFWETFDSAYTEGEAIVDGEFTEEDFEVQHSFEGDSNIIVLLEDGDSFSTCVVFTVEPAVEVTPPATYSIEAEELNQLVTIAGTGFPEGTVDEDAISVRVTNFKTGSTIETYDTIHDETDVSDTDPTEGDLEVTIELDALEAGIATLLIPVDGSTRTFEDEFYVSSPTDVEDFTRIEYGKVSDTEGVIGDDVTFSFINLPSGATVDVTFEGETVSPVVVSGESADDFGAFEGEFELADLPGGDYAVRAVVTADGTTRSTKIGEFTILPTFEIQDTGGDELDEGQVEDEIMLVGNGFPADSTISTATFGSEEVALTEADTGDTGTFEITEDEDGDTLVIPHVSGGGKSVTVTVEGEDAEGDTLSAESSIIINPLFLMDDSGDWDPGVLDTDGEWTDFTAATIFPGNPIKVVGWGYLASESVTVKLYDSDDDLTGSASIKNGESADSSGDLELVAWLPVFKALSGMEDVYLTVAGATSTNDADSDAFDIAPPDDAAAKLLFGLEDDGDLDTTVNVGNNFRVLGCGFETKSLTLNVEEEDIDVKKVTATNGYFETTITIPELEGDVDGETYTLTAEDAEVTFDVYPLITLTPSSGHPGDTVTVNGAGFRDGSDVALMWLGTAEEEELDTVDGDDVDTGSFSMEVEIPAAIAQAYSIKAVVDDETWDSATFTIISLFESQLNNTLKSILDQLKSLDVSAINSAINSLKSDVSTLKSDVAAAKDQASAAKTSADSAKTAADTAKTSADSAKTAADTAKTTADSAKTAADSAKTAADNAKTAADSAKTAADNAKASADSLAGLVYAAIGASAVAAIAAIFAVIQLQRKVAG